MLPQDGSDRPDQGTSRDLRWTTWIADGFSRCGTTRRLVTTHVRLGLIPARAIGSIDRPYGSWQKLAGGGPGRSTTHRLDERRVD